MRELIYIIVRLSVYTYNLDLLYLQSEGILIFRTYLKFHSVLER